MKVKYRVKGISCLEKNRGKTIYRIVELEVFDECEDLDEYPINKGVDFRNELALKDKYPMDLILDWKVVVKKAKEETFEKVVDKLVLSEELRINIALIYKRMEKELKGFSSYKKLSLILKVLNIGYEAQIQVLKGLKNNNIENKKRLKNKRL